MVLLFHYFHWHYGRGIIEYLSVWKTSLWFVPHFFSLSMLFTTLFSPWHRLKESYKGGFSFESIMETIVVNILMRIVGFIVRAVVIVIGVLAEIAVFVGGGILFALWFIVPFLVPLFFILGVSFFFI
jgi:hypothetical protein